MGSHKYVSKRDNTRCNIFIKVFGSFLALSARAAWSSFREASSSRDSHVTSPSVASRSDSSAKARVPRAAVLPAVRIVPAYRGRFGCSDQRHWEGRLPLDRRARKLGAKGVVAVRARGMDRVQRRDMKAAGPIALGGEVRCGGAH